MLSEFERLSLKNQYIMLDHFYPDSGWDRAAKIMERGFQLEINNLFRSDLHEPFTEAECKFVIDVASMYDALQRRFKDAGHEVPDDYAFPGFDGNNEGGCLDYWQFLHKDEGKWDYLRIRNPHDLNSHYPVREMYERMLEVWHSVPLAQRYSLSETQAAEIWDARVHPDNR